MIQRRDTREPSELWRHIPRWNSEVGASWAHMGDLRAINNSAKGPRTPPLHAGAQGNVLYFMMNGCARNCAKGVVLHPSGDCEGRTPKVINEVNLDNRIKQRWAPVLVLHWCSQLQDGESLSQVFVWLKLLSIENLSFKQRKGKDYQARICETNVAWLFYLHF